MKFISWNVNGFRAWTKKGLFDWFLEESPDFFCLQEVKAREEDLDKEFSKPEGFFSYFNHPKEKKGYSGVAIYAKEKPGKVEYSLGGPEDLDNEGRFIALHYPSFVLCNIYFPNGGQGPDRLKYKMRFYEAFLLYAERVKKKGKTVVFCGDVNTAHTETDLARPKDNELNTGFLPVERSWVTTLIENDFIDVFRYLNPQKTDIYTYWDMKTRARERNVGWRIDYFFVSKDFLPKVKEIKTLTEVLGSDHCPLVLETK